MIVGEYFILQFVWTFFIKWVSGAQPFLGWRPPWPQQDIPGTPTYACREWLVNSYNSYKYIITILPAIFAVFHTVDYPKQVKLINPVSPICVQIARFDTFKMRAVGLHTPNDHFACICYAKPSIKVLVDSRGVHWT